MQRSCLLVAILRVESVDRREFTVVTPPNKSFFSDNASEFFENTCLGPVGYQVSAAQFPAASVDQLYELVVGSIEKG